MKKTAIITAFFVVLCLWTSAQQKFQWGVKAGGNGLDMVNDIVPLGDNLYVTGKYEDGFSSGGETGKEGKGIYLLKLDQNGQTSWVQTMTGDAANNATRLAASGENILVGGISFGTADTEKKIFTGQGQALFVSSWSEKGKAKWFSQMPFSGFATLDVLETNSRGDILAGGMFQGTLKTERIELNTPYNKRAYLMNLSPEGNPKSVTVSEGKGSHRLVSVAPAADGGRFLLFSITGDFGFGGIPVAETPRSMETGLALVKTAPSGDATWMKVFPGTEFFEGIKVLAFESGDALVCANYNKTITVNDTVMTSKGRMETALLLFSPDGRLKKAKTLTSQVAVRALDVLFTHNGNVLVTGYFRQEYSTEKLEVKSKSSQGDLFLLQTDANLEEVWHDEPGQDAASFSKAITLDPSGNIILAGAFTGQIQMPDKKLVADGSDDVLVAKYFNCGQKDISIVGNPVVCEGGKTELTVSGDFTTYLWNNVWGQKTFVAKQPGTYTVVAFDRLGCSASDTVVVKSASAPLLGLPRDTVVSPGQTIRLQANKGFRSYRWDDGSASDELLVDYSADVPSRIVTVSAVSPEGCTAADTITVRFAKAKILVPETPVSLRAWPNPVEEKLWWYLDIPVGNTVSAQLCDEKGSPVYLTEIKGYTTRSVQTVDMKAFVPGSYLFTVRIAGQTFNQKIVKK